MSDDMLLLPGVWFDVIERTIAYCPACGLKAAGREVTKDNVRLWFMGVDFGLSFMGFLVETGDRDKDSEAFMENWTQESKDAHGYPWEIKP